MAPTVLTLYPYYAPAYRAGGVVRSLENMAGLLAGEVDFRVVCGTGDLGNRTLDDVVAGNWTEVGPARVLRLPGRRVYPGIAREVLNGSHDLIYLNGLFRPDYGVWPLVLRRWRRDRRRPVLIAPRGLFSPGAFDLNRRRKSLYMSMVRSAGLLGGVTFHASTVREERDIRAHIPEARVIITPNPVVPPALAAAPPPVGDDGFRAVFVSRISPKKNLLGALRSLRHLRHRAWLTIVGPVDDADYWAACRREIAALDGRCRVEYRGYLPPADLRAVYRDHDALFFPTFGENFGHVIYEALAAGVPVLIGEDTPWSDVESNGAGEALPPGDEQGFAAVLDRWWELGRDARHRMREAAVARAERFVIESRQREAHLEMFAAATGADA